MAREYVYFASFGDDLIKIGTTNDVWVRMSTLRIERARDLTLLYVVPGNHRREHELHRMFAVYNYRGPGVNRAAKEWFRVSQPILEWCERHAIACDTLVRKLSAWHVRRDQNERRMRVPYTEHESV